MESPTTNDQTTESPKYWAFISYRHADNKVQDREWASWLHQEIERYEVPAELVGTENPRGDIIPDKIYPVFRDEESLPADTDLANSIRNALDQSKFLVALCSPSAVESKYVAQEIEHFKASAKGDRIIAGIISGEPGDKDNECFPIPLREIVTPDGKLSEPIASDFRLPDGSQGFTSSEAYKRELLKTLTKKQAEKKAEAYDERLQLMKLKIIAGILGVPLETLRNRDKAYQLLKAKKRQHILTSVITTVSLLAISAVIASIFAISQKKIADEKTIEAEKQTELAGIEKDKVQSKSEEQRELLWQASRADHEAGVRTEKANKQREAFAYYARALDYMPENELVAKKAMSSLLNDSRAYSPSWNALFDSTVYSVEYSQNGDLVAAGTQNKSLHVFDSVIGKTLWSTTFKGYVHLLAFSPDGDHLSASAYNHLHVMKANSGDYLWDYAFEDTINTLTYSPEGKYIAAGSEDESFRVFDSQSGGILWEKKIDGQVVNITFSPNGKLIATNSQFGLLQVFDTELRNLIWEIDTKRSANTLEFSPDGKQISIGIDNSCVRTYNTDSGKLLWQTQFQFPVLKLLYSPDGSQITASLLDSSLEVMNAHSGKVLWNTVFAASIKTFAYSPDGSQIAVGSNDHSLEIRNTSSGKALWSIMFEGAVYSLTYSPDGSQIAVGSADQSLRVFEANSGNGFSEAIFEKNLRRVACSPIGPLIAVATDDSTLGVYDLVTGKTLWATTFKTKIFTLSYSTNGAQIAAHTADKTLHILDAQSGETLWKTNLKDNSNSIVFSADSTMLAVGAAYGSVWVFNTHSGDEIWNASFDGSVHSLAFSPDGKLLATGSDVVTDRKSLQIFEAHTGKKIWNAASNYSVRNLAFSPDGSKIGTGSNENYLRIYDSFGGKMLWKKKLEKYEFGFTPTASAVVFAPDGKHVAVGSSLKSLSVFQLESGDELWSSTFRGSVYSMSYSPNGRYIAANSSDSSLRIFDAHSGKILWNTKLVVERVATPASFSLDGAQIAASSSATSLRIFHLSSLENMKSGESSALADYLRYLGQYEFTQSGSLAPPSQKFSNNLRKKTIQNIRSNKNDSLSRYLRWKYSKPHKKTVSPNSIIHFRSRLSKQFRLIRTEKAIDYSHAQAPWHPLCPVSLASLPRNKDNELRKKFLCSLTLKRLKKADVGIWGKEHLATDAEYAAKWMKELGYPELAEETEELRQIILSR